MLPMPSQNGQVGAQDRSEAQIALQLQPVDGNMTSMERRLSPAASCNCVFRYPSPFGRLCSTASEPPAFCLSRGAVCGSVGRADAFKAPRHNTAAGMRPAYHLDTGRCVSKQLSFPSSRLRALRHAGTHSTSRRLLVPALAPQQRRLSAATLRPVRSSAARPTWSIAKNSLTPANWARATAPQTDVMQSAFEGLNSDTQAIGAFAGADGFFVAKQGGASTLPRPKGRDDVR